ncbi:MAG: EAL domain-containing protein [Halarcobacter sp.]
MIKRFTKLNKFTDTTSSTTTILLVLFGIALIFLSYIFFQDYKKNLIKQKIDSYNINVAYLNTKLDEIILNHNKAQIKKEIEKLSKTSLFSLIKLENNRFIFNKNSLFENSKEFKDRTWNIGEVVVDIRFGSIIKLPNSSLYEFIPSNNYNIDQTIKVRYQVYKNSQIKNIIAEFDFSSIDDKIRVEKSANELSLSGFLNTFELNKSYEIKKQKYTVSTVTYNINLYYINKQIQDFMFKIILFSILMYLPILFVLGFYHKYLFNKYVTKSINYLNTYIDNILDNKFSIMDKTKFEGTPEIKQLTKKVSKLSSKVASLRNELNINKETLELKASIDTLTNLPNKNVFDFDIKSMYVSTISGYVFILKIEKLTQISEKYDSGYINSFIQSYVNVLKNVIFKYNKEIKLYRFYGSKFAIIARNFDMEQAQKMCEEIISKLYDNLSDIYYLPDDYIQIGGTFFDVYGSLDSLLKSTDKAYESARAKGVNSYHIIAEEDIDRNYTKLDNSVVEVIERADFELKFVMDSYLFDDENKLIMSEASPQLFDENQEKIQIGSFISIADKLHIADKFDKLVIVKVIAYIRGNDIQHKIAINLSMTSIKNRDFMAWLTTVLEQNHDIIDKIVFSITSYTAYLNKDTFMNFIEEIHKVGAQIILKRYKTTEYPLDEIQKLNLDFIRMSNEYTENFVNDVVKKHKVKNIIIFAELNNIKVITDSVKNDADYDLLERLGTYATSR